jgi:hypothetical protein
MNVSKSFVQEFVLGFGFLSGVWIYAGVNPETEIIKALSSVIAAISPHPIYSVIFWLLPVLSTIAMIVSAFFIGRWFGLLSVVLAFIGGVLIGSPFGIVLLLIAILLGFAAPLIAE